MIVTETNKHRLNKNIMAKEIWICKVCGEAEGNDIKCQLVSCSGPPTECPHGHDAKWREVKSRMTDHELIKMKGNITKEMESTKCDKKHQIIGLAQTNLIDEIMILRRNNEMLEAQQEYHG